MVGKHRTPILCCIKAEHYADAKKAFSTLNSSTQSEADIKMPWFSCKGLNSLRILLLQIIETSGLQSVSLVITQAFFPILILSEIFWKVLASAHTSGTTIPPLEARCPNWQTQSTTQAAVTRLWILSKAWTMPS